MSAIFGSSLSQVKTNQRINFQIIGHFSARHIIIDILVITEQNRKIEECLNSIAKFNGRIDGVQEGRSDLETESIKSLTLVQSKIEKEKRILESLKSRIGDQTGKYGLNWLNLLKSEFFPPQMIYFRNV